MVRPLSALYGILALLVPRRLISLWERIAFEETGDAELRSWVVTVARLEGLVFLVSAIRDEQSSTLQSFLGLFGLVALLAPRQYLDFGLGLSYENADDMVVKSWLVQATRLFGLVFLVNAIRNRTGTDSEDSQRERPVGDA